MPIGTAVHERTFGLCESLNYREWSGYYAVSAYEMHHHHEYNAIRNAAALFDISPLYKYVVKGVDALKLIDRIVTRDMRKVAVGQMIYVPWCDEEGKVIDDGTISRLDEQTYRWTAAAPGCRDRERALGRRTRLRVADSCRDRGHERTRGRRAARARKGRLVTVPITSFARVGS